MGLLPLYKNSTRKASAIFIQGQEDSNPRPTVLETGTLPAELYPYLPAYYITYSGKLQ